MLLWNTIFGLLTASAVAVTQPLTELQPKVVPNAYILQLNNESHISSSNLSTRSLNAHEIFHKRAANVEYTVRREFQDPSIFFGLSVDLKQNLIEGKAKELLLSIPDVVSVWPVYLVYAPNLTPSNINAKAFLKTVYSSIAPREGSNFSVPKITGALEVNSPHLMSDIDKLHSLGIKGKGIKIGIIDMGVDYRHPALGGGFGAGHKVAGGFDFFSDNYTGFNNPVESPDPLATCYYGGGHGSHVSGIFFHKMPTKQY